MLQPTITQVRNAQLDGVSNPHVFTNITMFTYIIPVKCNVQIINGIKYPTKCFGLVIVKIPKTTIIIPLWPSYRMPQNPKKKSNCNQTLQSIQKCNNLGSQMVTNYYIYRLKVETTVKERNQKLLDLITIDVLNIEQQHTSDQDIITLLMTPIINSYFNKHPISCKIIHCHILHPSYSVMKSM